MIKKAVLLCGGLATRLLPITKTIPKEMLPILNRPAIDYCIEDLKNSGITDVLIVLGRNKECIENYYDRNIELELRLSQNNKLPELQSICSMYKGVNLSFIRQRETRGTGFATSLAKEFVGNEPFILLYPDDLIIGKSLCSQLISCYTKTKQNVLPLKKININDCFRYGMVGIDNSGKINAFIEKPNVEKTPSDICYMGGGIFKSEIFNYLEDLPYKNGEQLFTDIFPTLIKNNALYGIEILGERVDIGTPLGYLKCNIIAGLNTPSFHDDLLKFLKSIT